MSTLESALELGDSSKIETWIHNFLLQPEPHGNRGLSEGLELQKRFWIGPIKLDLSELIQVCGPDSSYPFYEPEENWNYTIEKFICRLKNGEMPPPLIVEYKNEKLHIADGNHRFAALKEVVYKSYWCFIWFSNGRKDAKRTSRLYCEGCQRNSKRVRENTRNSAQSKLIIPCPKHMSPHLIPSFRSFST